MGVLESAIGWLAPPQCINCGEEGMALCDSCSHDAITPFGERCWHCNSLSRNGRTCLSCRQYGGPASVWIVTNHDGAVRDLVSLYKFGHQRAAAKPIARLMADTFRKLSRGDSAKDYLIVPVPTATNRVRERGFGHAEFLAKQVAAELWAERSNALRRLGQTRQLGATRAARLKQLSTSFAVRNPHQLAGRRILLIDDVVTTGGTIISATKTLKAAGAKQVDALLFAKRL